MKLTTLNVGLIGTNCYIVYQEQSNAAVVIDPSDAAELVLARIDSLGLNVRAILLTHGHFDHGGDAKRVSTHTGAPIYVHNADRTLPTWLTHGLTRSTTFADGDELDFDGLRFSVLHTPGHTPGSVCLLCGNWMFVGDTLFAGSCGRTDLPGGSAEQMQASLRRLAALAGEYEVYPGHGEATTLTAERATNPYIQMALEK